MALQGKGFFIWKILSCEGGVASTIANMAADCGLSHVLIKIADGVISSNVDPTTNVDRVPPVAQALRAKGIQVWGWHYVYGNDPLGEARRAIQRITSLNLDGYVIDAEAEYKQSGKDVAARRFMSELRNALPSFPIALSSYRYPTYHPQLPWGAFLEKCNYNMPQVYWEQAHNPGTQLARSVQEFKNLEIKGLYPYGTAPYRPIIPVGPTYKTNGWAPTQEDILEFLNTASSLGLTATNFFSWEACRRDLPHLWYIVRNYSWPIATLSQDLPQLFINSLNTRNPSQVMSLYHTRAVHITPARTIQSLQGIQNWYSSLFTQLLPNASFALTGQTSTGNTRHFTWRATSSNGSVKDGRDTLGLMNGRISYHYSNFTITPR